MSDDNLNELPLSQATLNALRRAEIKSLEKLRGKSRAELLAIRELGVVRVEQIQKTLAAIDDTTETR